VRCGSRGVNSLVAVRIGSLDLQNDLSPAGWGIDRIHNFAVDVGSVIPEALRRMFGYSILRSGLRMAKRCQSAGLRLLPLTAGRSIQRCNGPTSLGCGSTPERTRPDCGISNRTSVRCPVDTRTDCVTSWPSTPRHRIRCGSVCGAGLGPQDPPRRRLHPHVRSSGTETSPGSTIPGANSAASRPRLLPVVRPHRGHRRIDV
jgi:hypothetical protein